MLEWSKGGDGVVGSLTGILRGGAGQITEVRNGRGHHCLVSDEEAGPVNIFPFISWLS